jgi:hypothetical protein
MVSCFEKINYLTSILSTLLRKIFKAMDDELLIDEFD